MRLDPGAARGAGRGRAEQAHPPRDPVDDDVEEASPGQAEDDDEDQRFHGITAVLTSPVFGSYK